MEKSLKTKTNPLGAGRKWFDGKDEQIVIAKLEETAQLDASVEECLFWADISRDSYYRYLKAHPDFATKLARLREKPILLARQTMIRKMADSFSNAMEYAKRKRRLEFGDSTDITTGGDKIIFMPKEIIDKYKLDAPPPVAEHNS